MELSYWCYDPWRATKLCQDFSKIHHDLLYQMLLWYQQRSCKGLHCVLGSFPGCKNTVCCFYPSESKLTFWTNQVHPGEIVHSVDSTRLSQVAFQKRAVKKCYYGYHILILFSFVEVNYACVLKLLQDGLLSFNILWNNSVRLSLCHWLNWPIISLTVRNLLSCVLHSTSGILINKRRAFEHTVQVFSLSLQDTVKFCSKDRSKIRPLRY